MKACQLGHDQTDVAPIIKACERAGEGTYVVVTLARPPLRRRPPPNTVSALSHIRSGGRLRTQTTTCAVLALRPRHDYIDIETCQRDAMPVVMPSQVMEVIDQIFAHIQSGATRALGSGDAPGLRAIIDLSNSVPAELVTLSPKSFSLLARSTSATEYCLALWIGSPECACGHVGRIGETDAVAMLRRMMSLCPDEHAPPSTSDLAFITDADLRKSVRNDFGAANRALNNSEWKGATVLAGSVIEALLL
jgi:hypothetical protein